MLLSCDGVFMWKFISYCSMSSLDPRFEVMNTLRHTADTPY